MFLISLPAVTVRFYAADEIEYFAYLRSMWFDGDLSFDNEYRYFYERGIAQGGRLREGGGRYGDRFKQTFLDTTTATGRRINFAPVGTAIMWAPFYVVADAGVRMARAAGAEVQADGYSRPYIAAVTYGSAVYGFLALVLSLYAASVVTGDRRDVYAALAVWMGTPLLFYMYLAPGFSHACSAFAVAAFVVLWLRVRREWSAAGVAALAALAALMGMVREQDLFIAIAPALDFAITQVRSASPASIVGRAAVGLATFLVCFLPQLISYQILYGRPSPSSYIEQKMTWTSPHAWRVLASPDNGLLFWTPLAVAALAGLVWLAARSWVACVCVVMVLTQIYIGGSLDTWAGAGSFGQRRLIGLTVFFVIGLSAALHAPQTWMRYAVRMFVVLAVWWNVGLIAQFGSGMMDRQQLDLARNAFNNFIEVPRQLPHLAYRFAFDRRSFYQGGASPTR